MSRKKKRSKKWSSGSELSKITFSAASIAGGTSLTGTVHLTATTSKGAVVTLALNNPPDPCVVPASVTVPAGSNSANFTIETKAVTENFTETIWGNCGVTKHASFTITVGAPVSTVSTPTFSPVAGTFTSTQSVTLTCATAGSTIYCTTDGSTPTTSSSVYTGSLSVSATTTIKAIAVATSFTNSAVGSATYTISAVVPPTVSTPTFSPVAGTYTSTQSVTLTCATAGATINYTTNGSTPTVSSTVYSSPISVSATTTVKALATKSGSTNSAVASAAYTISTVVPTATTPTFSPVAGTYIGTQSVTLVSATAGSTIYYTTDGSTPTASSSKYSSPISVPVTSTIKAIAVATGYTNSAVGSAAYTISTVASTVSTPTFSPAAGTYTSAQSVTLACATSGATIYYTTNGSTPTTSSSVYSGAVSVSATTTVKALATKSGSTNSAVASAAYTISTTTGGSLAAGLGTPSFEDLFNYKTSSDAAFLKNWVPQLYSANNYAGAGSNVTMEASNITFPVDPNLGVPCLCLTLNQTSASASNGGEILSAASLNGSTGFGGYGTYEFLVRFGTTSATPTGAGSSVSGGVSSTFLLSQSNQGNTGYVEIDAPECEGNHPTWAEYDVWFNSDSSGNHEPTGGKFVNQGAGSDSYLAVPTLATGFNYYGFIWSAGRIDYYLNGVLQGSLTSGVPTPGSGGNIPGLDINHYGCNSSSWGGTATVGTARHCYVQSVKFWA